MPAAVGRNQGPARPVEGLAREVKAERRVAEVDGPQRGDRPGFQVQHRDVIGINILVDDHFAAGRIQDHIRMPDDAQKSFAPGPESRS